MHEFVFQANVTGSIDSRVGGLQKIVDHDPAAAAVLYADSLQIEAFDIGPAADANQDLIYNDSASIIVANKVNDFFVSFFAHRDRVGIEANVDSVPRKSAGKNLGGVAFF